MARSQQTHALPIEDASALVTIRSASRRHLRRVNEALGISTTSGALQIKNAVGEQNNVLDLVRDWKRKANPWNLYQRTEYLGLQFAPTEASVKYHALSQERHAKLKADCASVDQFPPNRTCKMQSRFGQIDRIAASAHITQLVESFQRRCENVDSAPTYTSEHAVGHIDQNPLVKLADEALANVSNTVIDDVMSELAVRLRGQTNARVEQMKLKQRELKTWHDTRGKKAHDFLKQVAPPLKPMIDDLHPRPSATHYVRPVICSPRS